MVNVTKILKRSWHILWNYRMLWVFGFILALTVGGNTFNRGGGSSSNNDNNRDNGKENQPFNFQPDHDWQGLQGNTPREKLNDAFRQAGDALQKLQAQYPVEFRMGIAVAITAFVVLFILGII